MIIEELESVVAPSAAAWGLGGLAAGLVVGAIVLICVS